MQPHHHQGVWNRNLWRDPTSFSKALITDCCFWLYYGIVLQSIFGLKFTSLDFMWRFQVAPTCISHQVGVWGSKIPLQQWLLQTDATAIDTIFLWNTTNAHSLEASKLFRTKMTACCCLRYCTQSARTRPEAGISNAVTRRPLQLVARKGAHEMLST